MLMRGPNAVLARPLSLASDPVATWSPNQPKLISPHLDGGQGFPGFLPLSNPDNHAVRDVSPRQRSRSESLNSQETIMNQLIRAGAITVAIFSSVGFAAAQQASGPDLTPTQQRTVSQGLASSPSQSPPTGAPPTVGDKR